MRKEYIRPLTVSMVLGAAEMVCTSMSGKFPDGDTPGLDNGGNASDNEWGEGGPTADVRGEHHPQLHIGLGEEW